MDSLLSFLLSSVLSIALLLLHNYDVTEGGEMSENFGQKKEYRIRFKNFELDCWMDFKRPCQNHTRLIILTMSRRDGFDTRKSIRETWIKHALVERESANPDTVLLSDYRGWLKRFQDIRFLIADQWDDEAEDVQTKLEEEQKEHGDLVFLHGFKDTFSHLHLKMSSGFEWQQSFCADAKWVMKADDDAVVHLPRLDHWIEKKFKKIADKHPLVYFGYINHGAKAQRDPNSKWHLSEKDYPHDVLIDFMQGCVYLTTSATIRAVTARAHEVAGLYLDDLLYTGILAQLANAKLSDQGRHFLSDLNYDEKHADCEEGMPTALAVWSSPGGFPFDFKYEYRRLQTMDCK